MRTVHVSFTLSLRTARALRTLLREFRDWLAERMTWPADTPAPAQATVGYVACRTLESVLDLSIANAIADAREDEARKGEQC